MAKEKYLDLLEQPQEALSRWKAALYIRLSREDGDKQESYSVTSQREILTEYLKQHPDIECYDVYIDDGWSGTNFDRPSFQRMLGDINEGKVNCVIVKDLSRFGRNYTDAGYYIDNYFVRLNIRFIALNNGVDSFSNNMNAATQCITVGVQNVINESVAATTSVNVRGTLNVSRKQGKFIGSFPTYGYKKDPQDHHKLLIDEKAAEVVKMIYRLYLEGKSIIGITKELNRLGIPNPTEYKKRMGLNFNHRSVNPNNTLWCDSTVRRILSNEMYLGNMVQGKNTTVSYKIKQCVSVPKEDWIIVKGTHDPIIDEKTFELVQSLLGNHNRTAPKKTEIELFSGFVKCADCRRAMSKKTNTHSYGTYKYYRCVTQKKMDGGSCTPHSIRIDKLEHAVLLAIKTMSQCAVDLSNVVDEITKDIDRTERPSLTNISVAKLEEDKNKLEQLMLGLYPDWKSGAITQDEYNILKKGIAEKIKALEQEINADAEKKKNEAKKFSEENEFLAHFSKYLHIDSLSRQVLLELVDSILVHDNGAITINFKLQDEFYKVIEFIESASSKEKIGDKNLSWLIA